MKQILNLELVKYAQQVAEKIKRDDNWVCYGASAAFQDFITFCCIDNSFLPMPKYVCDRNEKLWGKYICGIKVVSPEMLVREELCSFTIVVTTLSLYSVIGDLLDKYNRCYYYIVPFRQVMSYFYYLAYKEKIYEVISLFQDEESRRIYRALWEIPLSGQLNYASVYSGNAYWENDIVPSLQNGWDVLYGGAYDGKHIDRAFQSNKNITFHAFEPNHEFFTRLNLKYSAKS